MATRHCRVGTWNVEYARGVEKNRRRLEHLASFGADVWIPTETHDDLDLSNTHVAVHAEQRDVQPGGRWTTVWTGLPIIDQLPTIDPVRCVAVRLDAGLQGELIVYGTVLPWNGDPGPDLTNPSRGWVEFMRVLPEQGREWRALRRQYPDATLVVAGDLNQDLGGRHYYGSKACRELLRTTLAGSDLTCVTTTDRFASGALLHPPIDHVCAAPGNGRAITATVNGWDGMVNGFRLSDHGGVVADLAAGLVS